MRIRKTYFSHTVWSSIYTVKKTCEITNPLASRYIPSTLRPNAECHGYITIIAHKTRLPMAKECIKESTKRNYQTENHRHISSHRTYSVCMCAFASKNGNNNNSILWILLLLLLLPHSTPVRYTKIFFSMPFYYTRYFSTLSSASVSMRSQCALFHRKRIMCKGARRESTTNGTNHQITKKK